MRFIVFENLKHFKEVVTRVYPVNTIRYFQYDKVSKKFKIHHTDGSWHTIDNDGPDLLRNEKVFENAVTLLKDNVTFK